MAEPRGSKRGREVEDGPPAADPEEPAAKIARLPLVSVTVSGSILPPLPLSAPSPFTPLSDSLIDISLRSPVSVIKQSPISAPVPAVITASLSPSKPEVIDLTPKKPPKPASTVEFSSPKASSGSISRKSESPSSARPITSFFKAAEKPPQ